MHWFGRGKKSSQGRGGSVLVEAEPVGDLTDQPDPELAALELRYRQHARVEDRIRAAKATGLAKLPFDRGRRNQVWLELVFAAQDLTCWTQALLLDGALALAEPKTLRYRLLPVAARVVHHACCTILRLQRSWPWPLPWRARSPGCARSRCAADPPQRTKQQPPPAQAMPATLSARQRRTHAGQPAGTTASTPRRHRDHARHGLQARQPHPASQPHRSR
jgi:Transposase DDE domain group 1